MRIGKLLKKWRAINELSIREVAEEIGIATATLYNLEAGRAIDSETMLRIVNWLFRKEVKK